MIWMEGFDGPGTVAALNTKLGLTSTGDTSLDTALTGIGSSIYSTGEGNADVFFSASYTAMATVYFSFKFKFAKSKANLATTTELFSIRVGTLNHCRLRINGSDLTAHIITTDQATRGITEGQVYSVNGYCTVANSGGRFVVNIDGANFIDYTGDTQNVTANTDNARFCLHEYTTGTAGTSVWLDHLVISDSAIPDCNIVTFRPAADGNYTQFTPSTGTDHYALVDEATLDVADYNASSTSGHRDSFKFAEPTFTGDIKGAALEFYVNKSDAGARAIRGFVRQGGTDYDGAADLALTEAGNIASQYYEVNPATSAPFTVAQLTGASRTEFGIKVQS
jgi:hypothetical protein